MDTTTPTLTTSERLAADIRAWRATHCSTCGKQSAVASDWDDYSPGQGEHLCWAEGDSCWEVSGQGPDELLAQHLAGVMDSATADATADALQHARTVITQYLSTAEKWRYDRVVWAFAVMLGEIPEDTPEPPSPRRVP